MNDGHSDWEKLVLDNFAPDVMLGQRPHGKHVWLVLVNDAPPHPRVVRPPPALVLIRGGRED